MSHALSEKLLNLAKRKTRRAEVVFSKNQGRAISFESSKLKNIESDFSSSIGLRVIQRGRVGVAATNKLESFTELVGRAVESSAFGPQAFFEFPSSSPLAAPEVYDPAVEAVSDEALVDRGRKIIERIQAFDPRIMVDLNFTVGAEEDQLLNSAGLEVREKAASVGFVLEGKLTREGDVLWIWEANSARRPELNIDFYLERCLEKFRRAQKISKIKSGRYPVVFTPRSFGSVLGFVITALNGKSVVKKSSRLLNSLGKEKFDARLTIADDGTLDWRLGSSKCDSEGVPTHPLKLIEGGIIKNFFYDLQTAGQMKTRSTGHGSRGQSAALSSPSLHNLLVKEGVTPYQSIVKNIKEGIVAEQFLGEGQDNPYSGDFAFNLWLGYKIENGEIVGRLKDTMIAGNAFELLKSGIGEISQETEWVGNSFRCPYVMLEGLVVSSR